MLTVDFEKAYHQAREMAQIAQGILAQGDRLAMIATEMRSNWDGETAAAYLSKMELLAQTLKQNGKGCAVAAEAFLARIAEIQAAEDEAVRILGGGGAAPAVAT